MADKEIINHMLPDSQAAYLAKFREWLMALRTKVGQTKEYQHITIKQLIREIETAQAAGGMPWELSDDDY